MQASRPAGQPESSHEGRTNNINTTADGKISCFHLQPRRLAGIFPSPSTYTHESRITYVIESPLAVGHAQSSHGVCNSRQTALRHILRRHRPRFAHNLRPHVSRAARRRRAFRASDRSETNVHSDVQRSHVKAGPRAVLVKGEQPNLRAFLLPETVEIPVRRPVDLTALPLRTRHSLSLCFCFWPSRSVDFAAATEISMPTNKRCPTASPGMFREVIA